MRTLHLKLVLSLGAVVAAFLAAEVAVRVLGETDRAGDFVFHGRVVRPHVLPVAEVAASVAELESSTNSIVVYDATLGWTPRPGGRSLDGLYAYNDQGIRSPRPSFPPRPDPGVLRIALFGDSVTHANDVPYEDSFGAVLERGLDEAGHPAEVLNFGVGGYGLDQAFLRYATQGKGFAPDLVVLGFQPENLKRDLNLLRPLYDPRTRLPFAKPRFVLGPEGISLINVPVLPPDRVAPTLADMEAWPLRPREFFYDPDDYRGAWWQRSRLLATIAEFRRGDDDPWLVKRTVYQDRGEEPQLGWGIIEAFAREVDAAGADFMIVHLPTVRDLYLHQRLGRFPYQAFLDELDRAYDVVHPEGDLIDAIEAESVAAVFDGHYNARGNRIIATHLQDAVLEAESP